jgi:hypothetical protein
MAPLCPARPAVLWTTDDGQPLGELVLLRQTGSVDNYKDQFLALACHDADLLDHQLVPIYTAGLVNPLKNDIALRRPAKCWTTPSC